jgi:peptidoglycan/LPS O-acetylase OafA/YrhL
MLETACRGGADILIGRHVSPPTVKHFRSIDGLRAWLAWSVVLSHIVLYTATDLRIPALLHTLDALATHAVQVFIIISGFVITHLLLEKKERYLPYITRRFLRIYPIYFICLSVGVFASYLHFAAFAGHPWGDFVPQPDLMTAELNSLKGNGFAWHLLAHCTILHGAISNQVLNVSEYMFLGPAWSLSLEWQFYIVAPVVLFGLRSQSGKIIVSLVTIAGYAAYKRGWLGDFIDPSFLPGAALYFATGIATRLVFAKLPKLAVYPAAAVIIAAGFGIMEHQLLPFVFWMAFVAWLRLDQPTDALSVGIDRWLNRAFNSAPTRFLGARSYSTYLIHEPIIHIIVYVCITQFALGMWHTVLLTLILTPAITVLASVALYRYVEAPAIAYGKRLFNETPCAAAAESDIAHPAPPALVRPVMVTPRQ